MKPVGRESAAGFDAAGGSIDLAGEGDHAHLLRLDRKPLQPGRPLGQHQAVLPRKHRPECGVLLQDLFGHLFRRHLRAAERRYSCVWKPPSQASVMLKRAC